MRDSSGFKARFKSYKEGKSIKEIYDAGLPKYEDGRKPLSYWDNKQSTAYDIPFIPEKQIKLTDAGLATGAVLSTNLLDSIADNAYAAGLPIETALGLAVKESTLGNPTDDSSVRHILNSARYATFKELGTGQHIYKGDRALNGQEIINYHKGDNDFGIRYINTGDYKKTIESKNQSILKTGFEFYKENPDRYNPGQKNYSDLVNKRGKEVVNSPEVKKWRKEWNDNKIKIMRPEPYKINTTIQSTAAPKFGSWKDGKLPGYAGGKIGHNVSHAEMNDDGTFTDDYTKVFEDMYVTPQKTDLKRGSYTLNNFPYYLQHRTDWMKPFMSSGTNEKGLELTYPEFDILLGGRQLATTMFPLKKSQYRQFEEIDFDDIAKQAAKMKADDDAWMAAHPEYALENVLKPQKIFDVQGNIINGKSKDLLTRQINGWIEQHGIPLQEYTNAVKTAYQKQIIPRRAQSYANEQTTSGVSKISKYLKDNWLDDVDFSTKEGLQMAHDNGWSFEEMADWSNYKQYIQKLQQYSNGPWTKYEQESWKKLYPVRQNGSQVKGDYSTYNNKIRVVDYDGTDDTLLHEARHRMDNFIPLTKSEKNTLTNAYGNIWADSQDEIITTNADLRNYLLKINNAENTGLQVQNGLLNNQKFVNDYDILNALDRVNSYGSRAVQKIQMRLDNLKTAGKRLGWDDETINAKIAEERHKIADAIRYAITTVGGTSAVVAVSKK